MDWARLKAMKHEAIDLAPDHPEADSGHIRNGIVRYQLKPAPVVPRCRPRAGT